MEILQTIWNALTTENIELIKILSIPLTIIEAYVTMLLFTTILCIETTKVGKHIFVLSFSTIALISSLCIPSPFNTLINIISFPILVIFIFKTSLLKSIIAEIIPYVVSFLLTYPLLSVYTSLFNITIPIANSTPIYRLTFSLLVQLITFIIAIFLKKFNININIIDDMRRKNKSILLFNFIFGIVIIFIQLYIYNFLPMHIAIICSLSFLVYFCISLYSLSRTTKLEETYRDLEGEKLVNKSLTILHDNIRAFKHDFNNIVQAIGGYVTTNDMDGLKKYYSQLFDDCQRVNNLTTLSPEVINNPPIYSLLASKYHKADELGIKIDLEIFLDLNTLKVKIYELARILGILLDNAIEATLECDEKLIKVEIRKDNAHHRDIIIIKNTYLNKDINLDKIFEKSFSTKPNNTGLGLWEARQILKKNNNLNLFTNKDDKFFIQQLKIYF